MELKNHMTRLHIGCSRSGDRATTVANQAAFESRAMADDKRGWPVFEFGVAQMVDAYFERDRKKRVLGESMENAEASQPKLTNISPDLRCPEIVRPVTRRSAAMRCCTRDEMLRPEALRKRIETQLENVTFTGKGDKETVKEQFKKCESLSALSG
jgi:hypothetical protein